MISWVNRRISACRLVFSQLIQFSELSWKTVLLSPSAVRRISSP